VANKDPTSTQPPVVFNLRDLHHLLAAHAPPPLPLNAWQAPVHPMGRLPRPPTCLRATATALPHAAMPAGPSHLPCLCHLAATLAKRACHHTPARCHLCYCGPSHPSPPPFWPAAFYSTSVLVTDHGASYLQCQYQSPPPFCWLLGDTADGRLRTGRAAGGRFLPLRRPFRLPTRRQLWRRAGEPRGAAFPPQPSAPPPPAGHRAAFTPDHSGVARDLQRP